MRERLEVWGGLTCHVVNADDSASPKLGVVFCHGFGAPGTDLVPLAGAMAQLDPRLGRDVQYVFPEAPISLAEIGYPFGRAWWRLNLERLQQQLAGGQLDAVRNHVPAELPAARQAVVEVLQEWSRQSGLNLSRCVLGGFSQGAMLSVDVALQLPQSLAGLVLFSGCVLNEQAWRQQATKRAGLPVFQSHGLYDDLLPFLTGKWVHDLLQGAGCDVEFVEFPGGHEIPWSVLKKAAAFLGRMLDTV